MNYRIPTLHRPRWTARALVLVGCMMAGCANTAVSTGNETPNAQQLRSSENGTAAAPVTRPVAQEKPAAPAPEPAAQPKAEAVEKPRPPRRAIDKTALKKYLAARQARHENDVSRAARYYSEALKFDPENADLKRRSFLLQLTEGSLEEALPMAREILEERPASLLANLALGISAIRDGRFDEADRRMEQAKTISLFQVLSPQIMAWTAAGRGDYDAGMAQMDSLKPNKAYDTLRIFHSAMLLAQGKRWQQAASMLDTWPASIRRDVRSELLRIAILGRLSPNGAEKMASQLRILTRTYGGENILGGYLSGDFDLARDYPVKTVQQGAAEVLYSAAAARTRDRGQQLGLLFVNLALHLHPEFDVAWALKAEILEDNGQMEKAIAAYQNISPASPYHWESQLRIAWALNQLGRMDQAAKVLNRMAKERPGKINALVTHGDILRAAKKYGPAEKKYSAAIKRLAGKHGPHHWSLFYSRGIAHERLKQWPKAEKDLSYALKLRPDQPQVLNYLGYSWADQGKNLEKAISMIKRAVELRPTDGYIVDSLGWVYFRLERYDEAVVQLERAIELQPEDPVINDHLGDAYAKVGRRLESCYQWQRVLTLEPEDTDRKKAEAKLKFGPTGKAGKKARRGSKPYCLAN